MRYTEVGLSQLSVPVYTRGPLIRKGGVLTALVYSFLMEYQ